MLNFTNDREVISQLAVHIGAELDEQRVRYDDDKVVILNLSELHLTHVPQDVFLLQHLKILYLLTSLLRRSE